MHRETRFFQTRILSVIFTKLFIYKTIFLFNLFNFRFQFVSVLLEHMFSHISNVEKIATMKMNIWVSKRNLKCTQNGCKNKFAYTLDYTKHRDAHEYEGLTCGVCRSLQTSPVTYARHLRAEHEAFLFLKETQAEDTIQTKQVLNILYAICKTSCTR